MAFSESTQALASVVRDARSRSQMYWAWHVALMAEEGDPHPEAVHIFQQYENASADLSNALEMYFEHTIQHFEHHPARSRT